MNPWPVEAEVDEVHLPRPGHADLAGVLKYGHTDVRNVLERASARETAARVAAGGAGEGVPARARHDGAQSRTADRRGARARARATWRPADFEGVDESPVRCLDPDASAAMVAEIDSARKANESLGGVFEVRAFGVLPGLGSHIAWDERFDARLAQAIMSIHAMKGVEIGDGFDARRAASGSQAHDEIFWDDERGYIRETNRAGGIEGGMTTGDPVVVRASR